MLKSARELFAELGFRGTTMRAVALRAAVDPALVHYFFVSKERLFAAAIEVPSSDEALGRAMRERRGSPGEAMLRFHLQHLFIERRQSVAAMLRAALADPGCVPALRALLEKTVVTDVAQVLGGKDSRLRAELAGAFMVGLFVVRHMVGAQPLADSTVEKIIELAAPALDALLRAPPRAPTARKSVRKS